MTDVSYFRERRTEITLEVVEGCWFSCFDNCRCEWYKGTEDGGGMRILWT